MPALSTRQTSPHIPARLCPICFLCHGRRALLPKISPVATASQEPASATCPAMCRPIYQSSCQRLRWGRLFATYSHTTRPDWLSSFLSPVFAPLRPPPPLGYLCRCLRQLPANLLARPERHYVCRPASISLAPHHLVCSSSQHNALLALARWTPVERSSMRAHKALQLLQRAKRL